MADDEVLVNRAHVDFGNFEEDVIAEILARLPVKSLMRSRCVCKPWCALISDSCFVKKHLSYQEKGITESPRRLIFDLDPALAFDCEAFKTAEDYQSVNNDDIHGQFAVIPLDFPLKTTERDVVRHIGSCNGLVCVEVEFFDRWLMNNRVTDSMALNLWNPCTRDFTVLPNPPREFNTSSYLYGFGFDSANDDYKVIRAYDSWKDETERIMTHVFSLKTGSWKTVKRSDSVRLTEYQGLFVNGALHWLSDLPDGSGSSILSFDLGTEEFQKTVPLPYDDWFRDPFIHSNCLCVCTGAPGTISISIWMMKEYGVKESWTQVVQLYLEDVVLVDVYLRNYLRPVCILENGVVLYDVSGTYKGLVVFSNLKDKTFMHFVEAQDNCFETVIYQETLVSPDLYGSMVACKTNFVSVLYPPTLEFQ